MIYPEDFKTANDHARAALDLMADKAIAPNPRNFLIWYEYFKAGNPDLTRALDDLLESGADYSEDRAEALYETFFGFDELGREIRQTGDRIQSAVDHVMVYLKRANAETDDHRQAIADISGDLAEASDSEDVARHVSGILQQTHSIVDWSKRLANRLGDSANEIVELRHHLGEVQNEAITDALTGLSNRKHFDERLRQEAKKVSDEGGDLCLLFADIDNFKKFNDSYGHRLGDQVLRLVGGLLRDGVSERDLPARHGGEEFAIIVPRLDLDEAVALANRIRSDTERKEIKNAKSGKSYGTVTVSTGVAKYRPGETVGDFMHRADEALYRAKAGGRNLVVAEIAADSQAAEVWP